MERMDLGGYREQRRKEVELEERKMYYFFPFFFF
jgi:hypothetical protein